MSGDPTRAGTTLAPRVKLRGVATDAVWHGERVQRWWKARPDLAAIQKEGFYQRRRETNLGTADCGHACGGSEAGAGPFAIFERRCVALLAR